MKIFLVGSKHNFDKIPPIKEKLEAIGHEITVPSGYADPFRETEMKKMAHDDYVKFKTGMLQEQAERVAANDAILVLNFDKHDQPNYIGGATFLEVYKAWELGKKIFFYHPLPEGMLHDELVGMDPVVIDGDLKKLK